MRILLIGIGGAYNYGCEAIVRGTERILREAIPGVEVVYRSPEPQEDARRLAGCDIAIGPRYRSGLDRFSRRCANKIWKTIRGAPLLDFERGWKGFDLVLSIGGDMYTQYGGRMPYSIMALGDKIMRAGIPYAVWGASIGPFRADEKEIRGLMDHFRRCGFITVREERTREYLRRNGVEANVFRAEDPAFALGESEEAENSRKGSGDVLRVGLNLSPLSVAEAGGDSDAAVTGQGAMIGKLVEQTDSEIVLLPHVVSAAQPGDDDLAYLRRVQTAVPAGRRAQVSLVENDPGFLGLKPVLRTCDVVLAARMHCGINAVSEGIPTLFLAYSEKARGMAENIYGHDRYVLDVRASDQRAFADEVCRILPGLRSEKLAARAAALRSSAMQAMKTVAPAWNGNPMSLFSDIPAS